MYKKYIARTLKLLGFEIKKLEHQIPKDFRSIYNHPRVVLYESNLQKQVIIEADLIHGRGLDLLSLARTSIHPFISAIRMSNFNNTDFSLKLKEHLSAYYNLVHPNNAAEWLGFKSSQLSRMQVEPAWNSLLPWENVDLEMKRQERSICATQDNEEHGAYIGIESGWRNFGPINKDVLDVEIKRLKNLCTSINNKGFLRTPPHGDVGAIVLMKDDSSWRWVVENGGQHRAAVLSALGYNKIPIKVWKIIEERDVKIWPNVLSGIYSEAEALMIFNRIFSAEIPDVLSPWQDYIDKLES